MELQLRIPALQVFVQASKERDILDGRLSWCIVQAFLDTGEGPGRRELQPVRARKLVDLAEEPAEVSLMRWLDAGLDELPDRDGGAVRHDDRLAVGVPGKPTRRGAMGRTPGTGPAPRLPGRSGIVPAR